jgi:NAD(P)H-hydrate epimerase
MENAGNAIADFVESFISCHDLLKRVTLLVGKGNNGGDAYAAGAVLCKRGFKVIAFHIYSLERCGPLCKAMYERFRKSGGTVHHVRGERAFDFGSEGILLDGLVGTGFKGKADGALALAIEEANRSDLPIIAIDIPSGLDGNTGEVATVAIRATHTVFLGLPKAGFFLGEGWDHVGKLHYAFFGLGEKQIADARPVAFLYNEEFSLPPLKRTRHKYQAGYVLAVAGSRGMSGAALLASFAALKSGAGIVRLFHPSGMEAEWGGAPYELIRQGWDGKDLSVIKAQAVRAKAMLLGPGIGRTKEAKKMVSRLIKEIDLPMVIDADALFFLAQDSSWSLPPNSVITPHRGEMDLLLGKKLKGGETDYHALCQEFAERKKITLVLKGAPTFLFHPGAVPLVITAGDPGMATAGSGDVLTGMIAAMLAQGVPARAAAALAVYLHGCAGEAAAANLTSWCMTASDLIDFLPDAFSKVDHGIRKFFCGHGAG